MRAQESDIAWISEGLMMVAFGLVLVFGPLLYRYEMALVERVLLEKNEQLNTALRQIKDLATKDELTGAFNRRHLLEVLGQHAPAPGSRVAGLETPAERPGPVDQPSRSRRDGRGHAGLHGARDAPE